MVRTKENSETKFAVSNMQKQKGVPGMVKGVLINSAHRAFGIRVQCYCSCSFVTHHIHEKNGSTSGGVVVVVAAVE